MSGLRFENTFVRDLPADPVSTNVPRQVSNADYTRVDPTPVAEPRLLAWSDSMGKLLGIDRPRSSKDEMVEVLAGNRVLPGMQPYAARYGGHQFGQWAGQLGDGRAITLAEVIAADGGRQELQLKGAGRTPYSRTADGRAVLRSSVREFACSEAMHFLGVPTTRALALVGTGEAVIRDMFYDGHPRARARRGGRTASRRARADHPNGVTEVDHVVAITPALERTVAGLEAAGLDLRRIRDEPTPAGAPRQAFFRLGARSSRSCRSRPKWSSVGGVDRPAFFWGVALVAPDLDQTVAGLGEHVSAVRPAVQPGRRIATLRRSAGISLPVALMTPADRVSLRRGASSRRSAIPRWSSSRRRATSSTTTSRSGARARSLRSSRGTTEPVILEWR